MKSLSVSQMMDFKGGDAWLNIASGACAVWAFGRVFFGISISCAASPLCGIICTKIVDGACAIVGVAGMVSE